MSLRILHLVEKEFLPVLLPNTFGVVHRVAFKYVQGHLTFWGDLPQHTRNFGAGAGLYGGMAVESQAPIPQTQGLYRPGSRATKRHGLDVHVGPIGKVQ
jgi:hypothetical protein